MSSIAMQINEVFISQTANELFLFASSFIYAISASYYSFANNISLETAFTDVNNVIYSTFGIFGPFMFYLIYLPSMIAGVGFFQWFSNLLLFILANYVPIAGFDQTSLANQILFYYAPLFLAAAGELIDFIDIFFLIDYLSKVGGFSNLLNFVLMLFGVAEGLSLNGYFNAYPLFLASDAYFSTTYL